MSKHVLACLVLLCPMLWACDPGPQVPARPPVEPGTRAVVLRDGLQLVSHVTDVVGKLVRTEVHWRGEPIQSRLRYRGLITVGGTERGHQFELDVPQERLEALFPLSVGKRAELTGALLLVDQGRRFDARLLVEVAGKEQIMLKSGPHEVFRVRVSNSYSDASGTRIVRQQLYYAPALAMVLKSHVRRGQRESIWRVLSVEKPGDSQRTPTPLQKQRSGTVMI
ncbi:hypothetical protein [Yunchengibacter salinarum]|uniref:hypothetical protein n=1 Tax=Yunchengibacter salinarum TaxID=3133399 RepID=UPI0035B63209